MSASGLDVEGGRGRRAGDLSQGSTVAAKLPDAVIILIGIHFFCGVAILSIPYAARQTGWHGIGFLVLFFGFGAYTSHVIGLCIKRFPHIKTYPALGRAAFGNVGHYFVLITTTLFTFTTSIEFVMISKRALTHLLPEELFKIRNDGVTIGFLITYVIFVFMAVFLCLVDFHIFNKWFAGAGVFLTLMVVSTLIIHSFLHVVPQQELGDPSYISLSLAFGYFASCFAAHNYLPELHDSVGGHRPYNEIMVFIFVPIILLYLVTYGMGLKAFGNHAQSLFFMSMPIHVATTYVVVICTGVHQLIRYILAVCRVGTAVDDVVGLSKVSEGRKEIISKITRFLLVLATLVISIAVPIYGPFMSLLGSLLGIMVAYIIPCVCFLKIEGERVTPRMKYTAVVVIIVSTLAGISGMVESILQMTKGMD